MSTSYNDNCYATIKIIMDSSYNGNSMDSEVI